MSARGDRVRGLANRWRNAAVRSLQKGGRQFVSHMIRTRLSGPTSPSSVSVRSGQLRNALQWRVTDEGARVRLVVFVDQRVIYARIHEFGGTIVPKKARALAIPLPAAKTSAGVSRWRSPREVANLIMLRRKGGPPILAQQVEVHRKQTREVATGGWDFVKGKEKTARIKTGSKVTHSKIIPLFVLKTSVRIPPRLGFRAEWARTAPTIARDALKAIKDATR